MPQPIRPLVANLHTATANLGAAVNAYADALAHLRALLVNSMTQDDLRRSVEALTPDERREALAVLATKCTPPATPDAADVLAELRRLLEG